MKPPSFSGGPLTPPQKKHQRKHFLINKPLQIRYMLYIGGTLTIVSSIVITSLYFGIWGGVLEAFGDEKVRNDLLTASRLTQYEEAHVPDGQPSEERLLFFKQAEKLSTRQKEIFKEILDRTNHKLMRNFMLLLIFISWGTIYISHKMAGPLYRLNETLQQIKRGNLKVRVRLREFDEAQFLADKLNEAIDGFDLTFSKLKNILRENPSNPEHAVSRFNEELSKIKTSADH